MNEKGRVMPRAKKPLPPALAKHAAALRARRYLDEIEALRFVSDAVLTAGLSQDSVAESLGVSQATIHRLVKKLTENPRVVAPSVNEIVSRAALKEISRPEMLRSLRDLRIDFKKWERYPDSEWANLRNAFQRGLVSKAEAQSIAEDAARKMVDRVTHSMELEAQSVPEEDDVDDMVRETTAKLVASLG